MNWDIVHRAFADEMEKIAETHLAGVSPETAQAMVRPMMETAGYDKARRILERAQILKTASKKGSASGRETATHLLAGGTAGRLLSELSFKKSVSPTRKTIGTLLGAGLAAADLHHQGRLPFKRKQSNVLTPGIALRTSQQVGRVNRSLRAPSLSSPR